MTQSSDNAGDKLDDQTGAELIRSAELWMTEAGIEHPAAMTAMLTGAPRHPDRPKLPMS